jgi:hypothetical protein
MLRRSFAGLALSLCPITRLLNQYFVIYHLAFSRGIIHLIPFDSSTQLKDVLKHFLVLDFEFFEHVSLIILGKEGFICRRLVILALVMV